MAFDPAPSPKYALPAFQGDTFILDLDEWSQTFAAALESKLAGYVAGTHAVRVAATALEGQFWRETDTGSWFVGTGTAWVQLAGPRVTHHGHSFTWDDQTVQNGAASVLGRKTFYLSGETVTLLGAFISCETAGATPSTFKLQYDHAAHGTFADVPGLTALQPAAGAAVFVSATGAPLALAHGDTMRLVATNAATGNSKGCEIEPITEHTS